MTSRNDTIFALSSGRVPAAIAVVRVSGPRACDALIALAGRIPPPRQATLVDLVKPIGEKPGSEIIDRALVLFFSGPASDTGEDVAEFHIHGGRAVLAALIESLSLLPGVRPAEPGEFTRRSVENGKRDLTSAEGLFDLINAETDAQRRLALRHLQGLLGDRAEDWRRQIIEASALIEAAIDFPDEEDVPAGLLVPAVARISALRSEIEALLAQSAHAERLWEGLIVAIAGPPNAGKSTLINRLARRDVAIVSPYAGTTRDVIEVHLDLGGYPVTLLDTAGIRESDDPVEREGIRRAQERAARADLVLWVVDAREPSGGGASAFGGEALAHWLVRNKSDLLEGAGAQLGGGGADGSFLIAAGSGVGIDQLIGALKAFAAEFFSKTESSLISRARHKALLLNVINDLIEAEASIGGGEEIVAENLRRAIHSLGLLTGRVDIEDILDSIFRDFCIGK